MKKINIKKYRERLKYTSDYNSSHYKSISIRFSIENENEFIEWLSNFKDKKEYIKRLISEDMAKCRVRKRVRK